VEIDAGDTFFYDDDGNHNKEERENNAADRIFQLLPEEQAISLRALWDEFESMSTPEARYARALDAFQPVLMGYYNKGWSWKKHKITKEQVLEKKEPLLIGSNRLWDYSKHLMDEAAKRGYIEE
jgi:putative hydrolase of HD superfamily